MTKSLPITDAPEIGQQLARIRTSVTFKRRLKLLKLFEYLVQETMGGRAGQLTQKTIAAEVFGLKESFDPQSDGTVRLTAARLRVALEEYYKKEAEPDEIRIYMLQRSYYVAI